MAVLQSTNVQGTLCVNGVAVGGGKDLNVCCVTASTSFTPTSDLVSGDGHVCALLVGGGGAGGKTKGCNLAGVPCLSAGGGGGGEVREFFYPVTASEAHCVIIGAGGQSGSLNFPSFPASDFPGEGGDTSINGVCCISVMGGGRGGSTLQNPAFGTCTGKCTKNGGCASSGVSHGGGGSSLPCYGKHYAYAWCTCGSPGNTAFNNTISTKNNFFLFEGSVAGPTGAIPTSSATTLPSNAFIECGAPGQGTQTSYGIFGVGGEGSVSSNSTAGCLHVPCTAPAWYSNVQQGSCCPCTTVLCSGIVCGGGGAGMCFAGQTCYDPDKIYAPGGCGADGVVILRWYE
jgi:hypothetical protein